ncbi:MAG: hypothetical protein KDC07_04805 [Chitinophagaceae bacterium]|nr:hypothetical protein [Chitinophagaceae bacterium]MCB9046782.1 hypothetical protein [Chitinophagales bacterium]
MRTLFFFLCLFVSMYSFGQAKHSYVTYNKLVELNGTDYVLASVEDHHKMRVGSRHILFVNAKNGEHKQIDFAKDEYITNIEQIILDSIGVNRVVVTIGKFNTDKDKDANWGDAKRLVVLSTDGKQMLTEETHFATGWILKKQTGTIVITGYEDSDKSGTHDKNDQPQVIIYDLRKMTILAKI